jgi:hypothetical protein
MDTKSNQILLWIDVFSRPDSSFRVVRSEEDVREWKPTSEAEQIAFNALIALENRQALKAWYVQFPMLNPKADAFRRVLEQATDDLLPIGKK